MRLILARALRLFPSSSRPRAAPGRRRGVLAGNHNTGGVVLYRVLHTVVPPLARAVWRPTVRGLHHVPRTGGVMLASNHLSFADSSSSRWWCRARWCSSRSPTTSRAPASRARRRGRGSRASACCPVDRDDTKAALASLDTALDVLGRGEAFGIYPEGTRSRDGRLYRGRTGVAHLALTAGVPVVPVGLIGTEQLQPVGSRLPRVVPVTVTFGAPIDGGRPVRRRAPRPGAARAHRRGDGGVAALSGQERGRHLQRAPARRLTHWVLGPTVGAGWLGWSV